MLALSDLRHPPRFLALLSLLATVGSVAAAAVSPAASLLASASAMVALAAATLLLEDPVPEAESREARSRRHFVLTMLSMLSVVLLLILGFIEVLAVLAAIGAFVSYSTFADSFVRHFVPILGAFTLTLGASLWLRISNPSEERTTRARDLWGRVGAGMAFAFAGLSLFFGLGAAQALGLGAVAPERAGFVLSFSLIGLLVLVRARGRLPTFETMGHWLGGEARPEESGLGAKIVWTLAGLSVALMGTAGVSSVLQGPNALALLLLGFGMLAVVASTYAVGIGQRRVRFDVEEALLARARREMVLNTLSVAMTVQLGVLGLIAFLSILQKAAGITTPIVDVYDQNFILVMFIAMLPLPIANIVRTKIPTDVAYDYKLKALSWNLSVLVFLLVSFGLFMGSGIAVGTGFDLANAIVILSVAALLEIQFVKTRALLPSVWGMIRRELAEGKREDRETKERIERKMMITYLLGFAFVAGLTFLIVASSLKTGDKPLVDVPSGPIRDLVFVLAIAGGVGLFLLAGVRYLQSQTVEVKLAKAKEEIGTKRLTPKELTRLVILSSSISAAIALGLIGLVMQLNLLKPISVGVFQVKGIDFIVYAILVGLGPYGIYHNREKSRVAAIDQRFPDFLRDLAENKRAGMTLTQAVVTSAKGAYGELTSEIRKMAAQIEWGVSFNEALTRFGNRVKTPMVGRASSLIVQANEAGGNVVDVLTAAANDSREIQLLLRERRTSMSIYVMIIYVSFFVFLAVIWILTAQFVPEVAKAVRGASGATVGGLTFRAFDVQAFNDVFFHGALVQGLGGGLVAGVMEEGRPIAGLKHAFIMIVISYVIFRFFIGG